MEESQLGGDAGSEAYGDEEEKDDSMYGSRPMNVTNMSKTRMDGMEGSYLDQPNSHFD